MKSPLPRRGRIAAAGLTLVLTSVPLAFVGSADAAIVPTVPLGTAAEYSVLGGSEVTNTGPSVLAGSLGVSPGTSITGFPPGLVNAPGTTQNSTVEAAAAQSALTTAYVNAEGRSVDGTTTAELGNQTLGAGVWSGPSNGALQITGPLVLDGAGDPNSVFIFQTDSSLTTASASTVTLINGAQECNVFWQVGSSATLGETSTFRGNILALTAITVNNGVTVHGRALARNAAVTLINDTFVAPTCDLTVPDDDDDTTTGTTPDGGDASGADGSGSASGGSADGGDSGTDLTSTGAGGPGGPGSGGPGVPGIAGPPKTGGGASPSSNFPWLAVTAGAIVVAAGTGSGAAALRRNRARVDQSRS